MALPASENTVDDKMVYVIKEVVDHIMGYNDTGADLSQGDFAVVGPYAAIADEDIANGAMGPFHIQEGIQVQADDLVTGELTFGTWGQATYWSAVDKAFSDTETAGYHLVGYLTMVKDTNGKIEFEKLRYAELVTS